MNSKRRPLPLEVSNWMEKDFTLRKITANSRLLTNDTRQNIVLSRQFFSNLLTLSYARYRKMAQYDFDKRLFLKSQNTKAQSSMPGYHSVLDQPSNGTTERISFIRKTGSPLICSSDQSFLSRSETKSDATSFRQQQYSPRKVNVVQPMIPETAASPMPISPTPAMNSPIPFVTSTSPVNGSTTPVIVSPPPIIGRTTTNQRSSTRLKSSRERLERLAQPKGSSRPRSTNAHVRAHLITDKKPTTAEDLFGKIENTSEIEAAPVEPVGPEKPKSALDDQRFRHLVDVFCHVHDAKKSNVQTVKHIIQSNPSLQDEEGLWKIGNRSAISRKAELDHTRQVLAEKLNSKIDVFLINVRG